MLDEEILPVKEFSNRKFFVNFTLPDTKTHEIRFVDQKTDKRFAAAHVRIITPSGNSGSVNFSFVQNTQDKEPVAANKDIPYDFIDEDRVFVSGTASDIIRIWAW